ncbi:ATP-dependent DNA helicase RecG [Dietzia sp.]|uniref:ATP-dependent DNA helicase RecG n=1 Tax=Dietzia sp. TaxID=1871616 RepID=UPI002FD93280
MTQPDTALSELVPSALAKKLARDLEIGTAAELLGLVPRDYRDRGATDPETGISDGDPIGFSGDVARVSDNFSRGQRPRVRTVFVGVTTESGPRTAVFFNMPWIKHKIRGGEHIEVVGIAKLRGAEITVVNPTFRSASSTGVEGNSREEAEQLEPPAGTGHAAKDVLEIADEKVVTLGEAPILERPILPLYPASKKTSTWDVLAAVAMVLPQIEPPAETLSESKREQHGLIPRGEAARAIHFPFDRPQLAAAIRRLKFDVALTVHLRLGRRRLRLEAGAAPASPLPSAPPSGSHGGNDGAGAGLVGAIRAALPYELTAGQDRVLGEISADLAKDYPTARLLQGEVGSGKTVVSLLAMAQVVDAGRQCALIAPTEVLAAQHARALRSLLGELAAPEGAYSGTLFAQPIDSAGGADGNGGGRRTTLNIALVTGSLAVAARREALLGLVTGEVDIVVGTHALFEESAQFYDLGLAVIDEQHRFGVEQRQALRAKRTDGATPHLLTMTATPIPRTIAMMHFGDMSTSTLTELPAGRQDVETHVVQLGAMPTPKAEKWVRRVGERISEEVAAGGRVFVVAPRIDNSAEDLEEKIPPGMGAPAGLARPGRGVEDLFDQLAAALPKDLRIGMVHGRLPSDVKDETMNAFGSGSLDVLVATTVIEVGVDVPEATMMVVLDADRFGISQLHQLRGRIGRGDKPGVCLLVATVAPGSLAEQRLEAVAATRDGFELAQRDLELRGEGDVFGSRQSGGRAAGRILSAASDGEIIAEAGELAARILSEDPELEHHHVLSAEIDGFDDADYLDRT